jgi:hypothetical protein
MQDIQGLNRGEVVHVKLLQPGNQGVLSRLRGCGLGLPGLEKPGEQGLTCFPAALTVGVHLLAGLIQAS